MANPRPESGVKLAQSTADLIEQPLQALTRLGNAIASQDANNEVVPVNVAVARDNSKPYMTRLRASAVILCWIVHGMSDAVPGALLPYIEMQYGIQYIIASLIFVGSAIGFLTAVPIVQQLEARWSRGKVLPCIAALNTIAYAIIIAQPPFPVVVICFLLNSFGFSVNLALNNSFISNSPTNGPAFMGVILAGYGLGGTIGPLLGTAMVTNGIRWSFFYFISMALCIVNIALTRIAFYDFEPIRERTLTPPSTSPAKEKSPLQQAMRDRTTILGAIFIFAYQGAEVTISGWVVSFLIDYRHGDPARVGYVTAGFWAGITLGRFLLCGPIHKLGERFTVPVVIAVWACLHIAIWLSRDVIGDAVTVGIIGLLTGPIAPVITSVLGKILDPRIQMIGVSIGWSVGSGGAAIAPFLTAVLSEKFGTVVLNPMCIVLCLVMESAWLGMPSAQWKQL